MIERKRQQRGFLPAVLAIVGFVLLLLCAPSAWAATPAQYNGGEANIAWFTDSQDSDSLQISAPRDLAGFAQLVNAVGPVYYDETGQLLMNSDGATGSVTRQSFSGKRIELKADIDMTGYAWNNSIGNYWSDSSTNYGRTFSGLFDGESHSIIGLQGTAPGLFGGVYNGTIQNVSVSGSLTPPTIGVSKGVGSIAGALYSGGIYDCSSDMTITLVKNGDAYLGGVVGCVQGRPSSVVAGCTFKGTINTTAGTIGGIVGSTTVSAGGTASIVGCIMEGTLSSSVDGADKKSIGGILGTNAATSGVSTVLIERCANKGVVEATKSSSVAGIAGTAYVNSSRNTDCTFSIADCYSAGTLRTSDSSAIIAGLCAFEPTATTSGLANPLAGGTTVSNCFVTGTFEPAPGGSAYGLLGEFGCFKKDTVSNLWYNSSVASSACLGRADGTGYGAKQPTDLASDGFVSTMGGSFVSGSKAAVPADHPVLAFESTEAAYSTTFHVSLDSNASDSGDSPKLFIDGSTTPVMLSWNSGTNVYEGSAAGLSVGTHAYRIEKQGYDTINSNLVVGIQDQTITRTLVTARYDVALTVDPADSLVQLVDASNTVVPCKSYDAATGVYTFRVVNGSYTASVSKQGFVTKTEPITIAGANETKAITLSPAPSATWNITVTPPTGETFTDSKDVVAYLYSNGKLVSTGYGDSQQMVVDEGTYTYVIKAPECKVTEGTINLSGVVNSTFSPDAHGEWLGSMQGPGPSQTWVGETDTLWFDNHPGEDTYYLRTAEDLAGLAQLTKSTAPTNLFTGKTLVLLGDIDLGNHEWMGIADHNNQLSHSFEGTFDGRQKTISNLTSSEKTQARGLFESLNNAVVKDLVIESATIGNESYDYMGTLAASAKNSRIENCSVSAHVIAGNYAGGIVGEAGSGMVFVGCVFDGSVEVKEGINLCAGGIASNLGTRSFVQGCLNKGSINVEQRDLGRYPDSRVGGLFGGSQGETNITSSTNEGSITSNSAIMGGIVGTVAAYSSEQWTIVNCINKGAVTSTGDSTAQQKGVAGVVGVFTGTAGTESMISCANQGAVKYTGTADTVYVGGVFGKFAAEPATALNITGSYNTGTVETAATSSNAMVGGLYGFTQEGKGNLSLSASYAAGTVSAGSSSVKTGALGGNLPSGSTLTGCFYEQGLAAAGIPDKADTAGSVEVRDTATMRNPSFVAELNGFGGTFILDSTNTNNGYPILGTAGVRFISTATSEISADVIYNGTAQPPTITVHDNLGNLLTEGTDYQVSYLARWYEGAAPQSSTVQPSGILLPSVYSITINGKSPIIGSAQLTYRIKQLALDDTVFNAILGQPFTGNALSADSLVSFVPAYAAVPSDLYSVEAIPPSDLTSFGFQALRVTSTCKDNITNSPLTGSVDLLFDIVAGELYVDAIPELEYTGVAAVPQITVRDTSGAILSPSSDYTVSFEDKNNNPVTLAQMIDADSYWAVVSGRPAGKVTGTKRALVTIKPGTFTLDDIVEVGYTGSTVKPQLVVRNALESSTLLRKGDSSFPDDYSVTYKNAQGDTIPASAVVEKGTYTVVVRGSAPNYRSNFTVEKKFTVGTYEFFVAQIPSASYTGNSIKPVVDVWAPADWPDKDPDKRLAEGTDYVLSYYKDGKKIAASQVRDIGEYKVKIEGKGTYEGTLERNFKIDSAFFDGVSVKPITYTGSPLSPKITVTSSSLGETLAEGTDFTVAYLRDGIVIENEAVLSAGTYEVQITGKGNYKGTVKKPFTVDKATLTLESCVGGPYTGAVVAPTYVVKAGGAVFPASYCMWKAKKDGADVGVSGAIDAGTYDIEITVLPGFLSNFTNAGAKVTGQMTIDPVTPEVKFDTPLVYTGSGQVPVVSLHSGTQTIPSKTYTITYLNASGAKVTKADICNAGTYTLVATPKNAANFVGGVVKVPFTIDPASVTMSSIGSLKYTGSPLKPSITLISNNKSLSASSYKVVYYNAAGKVVSADKLVEPGDYKVVATLNDAGNYTVPQVEGTFSIVKKDSPTPTPTPTPDPTPTPAPGDGGGDTTPNGGNGGESSTGGDSGESDVAHGTPAVAGMGDPSAAAQGSPVAAAAAAAEGETSSDGLQAAAEAAVDEAKNGDGASTFTGADKVDNAKYDTQSFGDVPSKLADGLSASVQRITDAAANLPRSAQTLLMFLFVLIAAGVSVIVSRNRANKMKQQLATM